MTSPEQHPEKLYVVVRADLEPGLQLAQSVHAAFQFSMEHHLHVRRWLRESNFLVCLSVPNEEALLDLATEACLGLGLAVTRVIEPDLGDEHTAIAIQPGDAAAGLCAQLPLALRLAVVM